MSTDQIIHFQFPYDCKIMDTLHPRQLWNELIMPRCLTDDADADAEFKNWEKKAVEVKDGQAKWTSWMTHTAIFSRIAKFGYRIDIQSYGGQISPEPSMDEVSSRMQARPNPPMNEHGGVHVAVAGLGLIQMRKALLLTDGCTDTLQDHLDRGWRILAICVQPDQRRPDYILGFHGALDALGNPITGSPEVSSPHYP